MDYGRPVVGKRSNDDWSGCGHCRFIAAGPSHSASSYADRVIGRIVETVRPLFQNEQFLVDKQLDDEQRRTRRWKTSNPRQNQK